MRIYHQISSRLIAAELRGQLKNLQGHLLVPTRDDFFVSKSRNFRRRWIPLSDSDKSFKKKREL